MSDKERAELEELKTEQSNILASIRYAKRIQDALLISRDELDNIFDNYSIVYKPKDIVSGDFYYAKKEGAKKYLVVGDCTGHGVPGGFMSILCNDYTMRAIHHESEPAKILELIDHYLDEGLHQNEINDGMDVSVAMIDYDIQKLYFSGANHNAFLLKKSGDLVELKGTRRAIGKETWRKKKGGFDQYEDGFEDGDVLYMFTDGFRDQFDEEGRKVGIKKFREIISGFNSVDMLEQEGVLEHALENHQGVSNQIDDILVLGVKL